MTRRAVLEWLEDIAAGLGVLTFCGAVCLLAAAATL